MHQKWMKKLLNAAVDDGAGGKKISWKTCRELALRHEVPLREAEAWACRQGICPSRYERSTGTLGLEGQARLLSATAAVVGCGGLGGLIVDLLARSGVGKLVLVDDDIFTDNNLNRQLLSEEGLIGSRKVDAAAAHVTSVNGAVETVPLAERLTDKNARSILSNCDIAVDGLDNNTSREILRQACRDLEIPMVHGAIGGFWGQATVLYPEDDAPWEATGGAERGVETSLGNPPFTPAFIASIEAAEAIRFLAGVGKPLRDLLWCDLGQHDYFRIRLGDLNAKD
ncbi:MAG: HesA/MoeB/ThiF family protein [Thermovirgaceae bacterium]